ncbi:hypothetical protein ACFL0U_02900 [Pseudomonadota bacterium]
MIRQNDRQICLRVKSFNVLKSKGAQYSTKKGKSSVFSYVSNKDDYVVFVAMDIEKIYDSEFYIVPTHIIDKEIKANHSSWIKGTKRNGELRKLSNHRFLQFGTKKSTRRPYGDYCIRWKKYKDNWDFK